MSVQKFYNTWENDRPDLAHHPERQESLAFWVQLFDLGFNVIPAYPRTKQTCRCWKQYQANRLPRWRFERWFLTWPTTPNARSDGRITQRTGTVIGGDRYAIDLKADGSVVVAPGSRHASGHIYEMTQPWTPEMVAGLPVYDPAWLPHEVEREHRVRTTRPSPTRQSGVFAHEEFVGQDWLPPIGLRMGLARRYLAKVPGTRAGAGVARKECFRLALILAWGFALPFDEAVACLLDWGTKNSNTDRDGGCFPWPVDEIAAEVRSATAATDRGKPGDKLFGA